MMPHTISQTEQSTVRIRLAGADTSANISLPRNPCGLILFAGGAASGSNSTVTRRLADLLNKGGFATVVGDLILEHEQVLNEHTGALCCGLDLLEQRLVAITDWSEMQDSLRNLPVGYFGLGIGADAAFIAASKRSRVKALVACGAPLDHLEGYSGDLSAAALYVTGNEDTDLLDRQRSAIAQLPNSTNRQVEIIGWTTDPLRDTHAVDRVGLLARKWFESHLSAESCFGAH